MAIMKIRNIGGKGVVKDLPSFELPPEAWTDSRNVRFIANRIEKIGGYLPVLMEGMPEEPPLAILSRNNTQNQVYGTSNGIYMVEGRNHLNVSKTTPNPDYKPPKIPNPNFDNTQPVGPDNLEEIDNPDYDPNQPKETPYKYDAAPDSTWYYTTLSNAIVMNTPRENPQGLVPYKDTFEEIPGWGYPDKNKRPGGEGVNQVDWKAGRIRSFRNYLIALDMTEGGVEIPQRVRWSNVAYVNELPPDWIENDESKDGGFNDLTDANGRIIDGAPLRDSFVIYTDQETYLMEYVGGVMIYQFKKLFSDSGVLAPDCAVEFEQKHFVITRDDIFVHNGSSKQPVASGRVKQYLIEEISSVNPLATKVFAYTPQKEIWITYVGPGQSAGTKGEPDYDETKEWTCNKCAIWNWEWDTWYFMDIPPSFDVNMAPPPDLTTKEWEDFSEEDDYWDSPKWETLQWSELGKDFLRRIPYIASADKALYTLDIDEDKVDWVETFKEDGTHKGFEERGRPFIAELYRSHLDMDEMVESTRSHKFLRHITPQFRGYGDIHCYVGGSFNPTNEPDWDNYQIFDIEEDVKIDAFSNNRYPAIRFVDFGKGRWSFQGYDVDFVVEGNR